MIFPLAFTALITPFTQDQEVDTKAFQALVERQIRGGIEALVIFGTTGESPTLSDEEKLHLLDVALEVSNGRIPIIVGSGDNNTSHSFSFTKKCKERGASGALLIAPYYNKPTEKGIYLHMQQVASAKLPLIFYYHPGRCGYRISPSMMKEIMNIEEVVGLKDCSCDPAIIAATEKPIYCGNDAQFFKMVEMGAEGSISVVGNILPEIWRKIVLTKDKELFSSIQELIAAIDVEVNPQPIKYLCSLLNLCEDTLRLPMISCGEDTKKKLQQTLEPLYVVS